MRVSRTSTYRRGPRAHPHLSLLVLSRTILGLADDFFSTNTFTATTILPESPHIFCLLYWGIRRQTSRHHGASRARGHVNTNILGDRVQFAMDESDSCKKKRDARPIHWAIGWSTEDSELNQFVLRIPCSSSSKWGKVWETVTEDENSRGTAIVAAPVLRPSGVVELAMVSRSFYFLCSLFSSAPTLPHREDTIPDLSDWPTSL